MQKVSIARLGGLDDVRVSVVRQPTVSVLSLAADVLGATSQGLPPQWRRALRSACPDGAADVLTPAFAPNTLWVPDCISPRPQDPADVDAQLDRIVQTRSEQLYADLVADFPDGVPQRWSRVIDRPARFLNSYVRTLHGIWQAFEPAWKRASDLMERETARVGTAAVTGGLAAVLATLGTRISLVDQSLRLPDPCSTAVDLADRRVVLLPLVSGVSASVLNLDQRDSIWVGYPVPGLHQLWTAHTQPHPPRDALATVLGPLRAELLRMADRGLTMGQASALLNCAPSAVTHHCLKLEQAGLTARSRDGKKVSLWRTETGHRLVELLSGR